MVNNLNFKCVGKPLKSFEQNFSLIQFKWKKKKHWGEWLQALRQLGLKRVELVLAGDMYRVMKVV